MILQFDFNGENKLSTNKNSIILAALPGIYYVLKASVPTIN